MNVDMSIVSLVINASVMVQIVMAILMMVSIVSWTMIFQKARTLSQAAKAADEFEKRFWSGGDLKALYTHVKGSRRKQSGMATIFEAGYSEFARLRQHESADPMAILEGAQRAMRVSMSREIDRLETNLSFLATVGSTSPYVGLFGTVWGIMNSFRALGNVKQATLAMVAPGIAEALVATAMGLFAAIPAVIGYNQYTTDLERLIVRYGAFSEEFASILQRQAHNR